MSATSQREQSAAVTVDHSPQTFVHINKSRGKRTHALLLLTTVPSAVSVQTNSTCSVSFIINTESPSLLVTQTQRGRQRRWQRRERRRRRRPPRSVTKVRLGSSQSSRCDLDRSTCSWDPVTWHTAFGDKKTTTLKKLSGYSFFSRCCNSFARDWRQNRGQAARFSMSAQVLTFPV